VERILSRYFGINTPVDTAEGKKLYNDLANALLDKKNPAAYNQAIMDFGAMICKPKNPLCTQCNQRKDCQSHRHHLVDALPVKAKKTTKKQRWLYYFIIEQDNAIYVGKRTQKDIWENLYQLVLHETNRAVNRKEILSATIVKNIFGKKKPTVDKISETYKQQLTHQIIHVRFIHITIAKPIEISGYFPVKKKDVDKYPFPKSIAAYLKQYC
jgi:A/G-specific adenine glycosylase